MSDQLALFSEPRVRHTDGETSRAAAKHVEFSAETVERQIMVAFGMCTRLTDEELCARLQRSKPSTVITARSRLKNRGLVEASKSKKKNAGGCDMTVWRITKAGYEFLGWRM